MSAWSRFPHAYYRIAGNFLWSKFSQKSCFPSRRSFHGFNFRVQWAIDHAPLLLPGLQRTKDLPWETVGRRLLVLDRDTVSSSDRVRLQYTKRTCENFHKSKCSQKSSRVQIYFVVLIFAFWSWVVKFAKIWTSQKFPTKRYVVLHGQTILFLPLVCISWLLLANSYNKVYLRYIHFIVCTKLNIPY